MDLYFFFIASRLSCSSASFLSASAICLSSSCCCFLALQADCCMYRYPPKRYHLRFRQKNQRRQKLCTEPYSLRLFFSWGKFFHNISSPKYKRIIYFSRCNVYVVLFIITQNPVLVKKPTAKSRIFGILRQFATHILCVIAPILPRTSHPRSFL